MRRSSLSKAGKQNRFDRNTRALSGHIEPFCRSDFVTRSSRCPQAVSGIRLRTASSRLSQNRPALRVCDRQASPNGNPCGRPHWSADLPDARVRWIGRSLDLASSTRANVRSVNHTRSKYSARVLTKPKFVRRLGSDVTNFGFGTRASRCGALRVDRRAGPQTELTQYGRKALYDRSARAEALRPC